MLIKELRQGACAWRVLFRIGRSGGFTDRLWQFGFHKIQEFFWLAENMNQNSVLWFKFDLLDNNSACRNIEKSPLGIDTKSFVDSYRCFGERLLSIFRVECGGHRPQTTPLFIVNRWDPQISHCALQILQHIGWIPATFLLSLIT